MARHRGAFVLAALAAILSASSGNYCCPNGTVYAKHTKSCEDEDGGGGNGSGVNINCTEGKYLLDPEKDPSDHFVVVQDGHLQIGRNESYYLVPPHMYCIARVQNDKDSSPSQHYMAYICFPGDLAEERFEDTESNLTSWRIFFGILQAISSAFLFVTLCIYILIPELRDLQGRCIMSTVLCQMFGYLILSMIQFQGHALNKLPCVLSAYSMYFTMLASYFWLSVSSFNVWRSVRYQRFPLSEQQLFWCYCAFGWLCPIVFLVSVLATEHMHESLDLPLKPNVGLTKCWFDGYTETWVFFYAPMSVLLACNVVFFVMTAIRLWRRGEADDNTLPGLKSSRIKCLLYLRLFVVMGMLWITEVISFLLQGVHGVWRVIDTMNSLQGVLIFLVVICRKRVVQALAKRDWGLAVVTAVCPRRCMSTPASEQEEAMLKTPCEDETYVPMDTAGREHT